MYFWRISSITYSISRNIVENKYWPPPPPVFTKKYNQLHFFIWLQTVKKCKSHVQLSVDQWRKLPPWLGPKGRISWDMKGWRRRRNGMIFVHWILCLKPDKLWISLLSRGFELYHLLGACPPSERWRRRTLVPGGPHLLAWTHLTPLCLMA